MSPSHGKLGMNPSHEKLDMNRSRRSGWLRLAGALALLGAAPFAQSAPVGDAPAGDTPAPLVPLYVVGQEEELLAIPGTVQAARRSELAFQFGGLLVERPVVAGQRVTAGTVLARLDPRDFEARLSLEQSRLNLARANYERFSRLRGSRTSPVSDAEVDRSRSLFEIAEVSTAQARKNLQDTTLRAPFDGVVAVVQVDNHTQIRARQPIATVEAADVLEVIIDLPERVVARVRTVPRDQPVGEVEFAVLPARRFPVTLGEIATRADPATQTFRVTLALERPRDVNLLPGMTATVYAQPEVVADAALRIPVAAIIRSDSGPDAVWVVDPADYRIERRTVALQEDGSRTALVQDGLRPGERIVSAGVAQLQEGAVIRPYRTGMLSE
jgi:membrane fusion protein, multidrug efflux system